MRNTDTTRANQKTREIYRLRVEAYCNNPSKCKHCKMNLPYEKRNNTYCSTKCSAIFNNQLGMPPRHGKPMNTCVGCGKKIYIRTRKYCRKCEFPLKIRSRMDSGEKILDVMIKKYLMITREHICNHCKRTEWGGNPIPLETHHKDGNSENNKEENLELVCKNCHAFTDTYGGKNRGRGRKCRKH